MAKKMNKKGLPPIKTEMFIVIKIPDTDAIFVAQALDGLPNPNARFFSATTRQIRVAYEYVRSREKQELPPVTETRIFKVFFPVSMLVKARDKYERAKLFNNLGKGGHFVVRGLFPGTEENIVQKPTVIYFSHNNLRVSRMIEKRVKIVNKGKRKKFLERMKLINEEAAELVAQQGEAIAAEVMARSVAEVEQFCLSDGRLSNEIVSPVPVPAPVQRSVPLPAPAPVPAPVSVPAPAPPVGKGEPVALVVAGPMVAAPWKGVVGVARKGEPDEVVAAGPVVAAPEAEPAVGKSGRRMLSLSSAAKPAGVASAPAPARTVEVVVRPNRSVPKEVLMTHKYPSNRFAKPGT